MEKIIKRCLQTASSASQPWPRSALLAAGFMMMTGSYEAVHAQEVFELLVQSFAKSRDVIDAMKGF